MSKCGYVALTATNNQALTAGATRTILGIKSGAAFGIDLQRCVVGFDASAAATGIQVELHYCTWATNAPGTNSTDIATNGIKQKYGRVIAHGITGARHWTTEPTVLTFIDELVMQQSGLYVWQDPLGQTPDCALAEGFAIRVITPSGVTPQYRAAMHYERT